MRYFARLAYNGAPFLGWQIQPQEPTVQGVIEQALARLVGSSVGVTGAGRTDTGVNARMMVAHFDLPDDFRVDEQFVRGLNALVGKDIAIYEVWPVAADAHARFDATERTYRYYVSTAKTPFAYQLSWYAPRGLDFEAMNRAARYLIGRQDFTSFSKLHTQVKTNICDVRRARWVQQSDDVWYFEITADRFLRNMVRAVVGTLVDVGRGKASEQSVAEILAKCDRCSAGTSMPGHALFLWEIKY